MPSESLASKIFLGTCEKCNQIKDVVDISDDPILTTNSKGIRQDINIICAECTKYFLNRLGRLIGEKEIAQ